MISYMKQMLKGKTGVVIVLLLIAALCMSIVGMTAHITTLQYDINNINNKISAAQWEQRNLEAKIKSSNTLASLEYSAEDLGLIHPTFDQIIYLDTTENTVPDFALALREIAYNK